MLGTIFLLACSGTPPKYTYTIPGIGTTRPTTGAYMIDKEKISKLQRAVWALERAKEYVISAAGASVPRYESRIDAILTDIDSDMMLLYKEE